MALVAPYFAAPAAACTCSPTTVEIEVANADVVVSGNVVTLEPDGDAFFSVDRYFKGIGPSEILIANPYKENDEPFSDCAEGSRVGSADRVLFLTFDGGEVLEGGYCTGLRAGIPGIRYPDELIQALIDREGGAEPDDAIGQPQESKPEAKDVPWIPILALSIAIPAAFLAASSFLGKRGGGH